MGKKVGKYIGSDVNADELQMKDVLDADYVDVTFLDMFFAVANEGYCTAEEAALEADAYITEKGYDNLLDNEKAYYDKYLA